MDPMAGVGVPARASGGYTTVTLAGELDLATASDLRNRLLSVLQHHGSRLILDLSAVSFCDATGLGVLVATGRRARLLGGHVRLAAPQPPVAKVLRLTGVDRYLATYLTVAAAAGTSGRPGAGDGQRHTVADPAPAPVSQGERGVDTVDRWAETHESELRETVAALLASTDAWDAADPERWFTPTLDELAEAYAGADPAALARAGRALLNALARHPLVPSAPVVETGARLHCLLDGDRDLTLR